MIPVKAQVEVLMQCNLEDMLTSGHELFRLLTRHKYHLFKYSEEDARKPLRV